MSKRSGSNYNFQVYNIQYTIFNIQYFFILLLSSVMLSSGKFLSLMERMHFVLSSPN